MTPEYDLAVVGCGLAGSATAWAAARRGASVLVLERFGAGHRNGSSHGSARIVRRAYRDVLYTRLAGEAFELWREVERESGATVLRMLGALDFGPGRDAALISEHLTASDVRHEVLGAGEAERRWPGMRFEGEVVHHFQAGSMDSQAAVDTMTDLARGNGAHVRFQQRVTALRDEQGAARLELSDGSSITAARAVVTVGAWVPSLAGAVLPLPPMTVTQQQVFHFPRLDAGAPLWPSVIHVTRDGDEFYHLAGGRDGGPDDARKVGEHGNGTLTTAETRDGVIDPASRQRVVDYVRRWLPGLDPSPRAEASCLYTHTPNGDFLIDRAGPIVVSSPCSGHGAKFAPLIGEWNVRLAFGEGNVPDRFRLASHQADRGVTIGL